MPHTPKSKQGFTLIELLVVIAIIGILAGMIIPAAIDVMNKGKVTKAKGTLKQLETKLVEYYTEHQTYPPAYGFLSKNVFNDRLTSNQRRGIDQIEFPVGSGTFVTLAPTLDTDYFVTESYMDALGIAHDPGYYDNFGFMGSDTDYDGITGLLEYVAPTGDNQNTTVSDYSTAVTTDQRPMIYISVNMRQFNKAKQFWDANGGYPELYNAALAGMEFPPASYDGFAVVSAGLASNTFGMIYNIGENTNFSQLDKDDYSTNYHYHVAAMAAFYMLTRNLDEDAGDLEKDFDYDVLTGGGGNSDHIFPYATRTDLNGNTLTQQIGPGADGPIYLVNK